MPSNTPETQAILPVTPELLPCPNPWCSGRTKPRIFENICGTSWSVECAECDILCTFAASPEDAANNWNSRRSSNGAARILADLTANCEHCDGTGDVHSIDGEWRGRCHCAAALTPAALSGDAGEGEHGELNADLCARITEYLCAGGLVNPELMDHKAVRELLIDIRDALRAEHRAALPSHQGAE